MEAIWIPIRAGLEDCIVEAVEEILIPIGLASTALYFSFENFGGDSGILEVVARIWIPRRTTWAAMYFIFKNFGRDPCILKAVEGIRLPIGAGWADLYFSLGNPGVDLGILEGGLHGRKKSVHFRSRDGNSVTKRGCMDCFVFCL